MRVSAWHHAENIVFPRYARRCRTEPQQKRSVLVASSCSVRRSTIGGTNGCEACANDETLIWRQNRVPGNGACAVCWNRLEPCNLAYAVHREDACRKCEYSGVQIVQPVHACLGVILGRGCEGCVPSDFERAVIEILASHSLTALPSFAMKLFTSRVWLGAGIPSSNRTREALPEIQPIRESSWKIVVGSACRELWAHASYGCHEEEVMAVEMPQ